MSVPPNNAAQPSAPLVLEVRGGARICVPAMLDQTTSYVLLEQEDWFEDEIRFVRRWLKRGRKVIDVGAGYGIYTVAMARAVGEEGQVWAFEPTPGTADFLERTLTLNGLGRVRLIRSAVSDRVGQVSLALFERPEDNEIVAEAGGAAGALTVTSITLDEAAKAQGWRDIDFIKLGVEGHEFQALQGGRQFLTSDSPLVMFEIKTAPDRVDLRSLDLLGEMGYAFYRLLPGLDVLTPFERGEPRDPFLLNLFACKADRREKLADAGFLAGHDPAKADPQPEAWTTYASEIPYARELYGKWRSAPRLFSGARDKAYFASLAAFACSRDAQLGIAERCAWLERAFRSLQGTARPDDSLARRMTYARLAWETGRRKLACDTLADARLRLDFAGPGALEEPFLAPGPRYDRIAVDGRPVDWLRCAVTEQYERFRAFSSQFVVDDGSPQVLAPILELPFRSPEMDRRSQLVRMRKRLQAHPQPGPMLCQRNEENLNPEFWCPLVAATAQSVPQNADEFSIASVIPDLPRLKIVDVGAMSLGEENDPYFQLVNSLRCEVIGFEPLPDECEKLNRDADEHRRFLPHFIGDGSERTFHRCAAPMTSSLLEPNMALLSMFQTLGELTRVVGTQRVPTTRLDDIAEARGADYLKIDVQGGELMVLQGARNLLRDVLLVHTEAEFLPMYKDQPLFGDLDAFLRGEGFLLHKLVTIDGRTFKPMVRQGDASAAISQQIWCDVVYVRDFTAFERLTPLQLRKLAAMLHANYGSFDLAAVALAEHDRQTGSRLQPRYLDCFAQAGS